MTHPTPPLASLHTRKDAIDQHRVAPAPALPPLNAGEVRLRIERVAITTNNITYAAYGDAMRYWDFFPTGDAQWGHIPVWGYGVVQASLAEGIAVGERFYGYFPIASHLTVQADRIKPQGFVDATAHRRELPPVYNQYLRCSHDPAHDDAWADALLVVRPLFGTSYLCADSLADNDCFGAQQVVVSSASSKTAYGTAHCLRGMSPAKRVGLTGAANADFVRSTGCYDQVLTYDELAALPTDVPTLYLDFSGSKALRAQVRERVGLSLVHDCVVGSTQNSEADQASRWPDPKPSFFFAPKQVQKRVADWGNDGFSQRVADAQRQFLQAASHPERRWLDVVLNQGLHTAEPLLQHLHAGRADPRQGHVLVLG